MPNNFGPYQPYTGFQVSANNTTQDLGQRYTTKDYLLDVYPNIASQIGARKSPGLFACGYNIFGELGNSTSTNYSSPVQVGTLTNWKQISSNYRNSSAIKTDGTLWTWGYNWMGQLGNGISASTLSYSSPIQVGSLTNWKQVSTGHSFILAVKTDGTLWACGYNAYGQLGNGTITHYSSPIQIGTLNNWKQISCGVYSSSAIKTDGTLWAWGSNIYGQLGYGSTAFNELTPLKVGTLTNWKQVSCNGNTMSAIKTDGTLWTWGRNDFGQLGNQSIVYYSSPIQIGSLTNWKQVSCGWYHTIAIKTDGTLWTWGYNANGQLGNGTKVQYSSPIQIGSLTNWKYVSGGGLFTSAIKTDGTLWTFGENTVYGQLGNSNTTSYSSPIQIGYLTSWKQISCGYGHLSTISDGYI